VDHPEIGHDRNSYNFGRNKILTPTAS